MKIVNLAERIGWTLLYAFIFLIAGPKNADGFLTDVRLIIAEREQRKQILKSFPKRKLRHPVKMRIKYLTARVQRMSRWGIDQMFIPSEKRTEM